MGKQEVTILTNIELTDENREAVMREHYGNEVYDLMVELHGEPTQVGRLKVATNGSSTFPVLYGKCACLGDKCRDAWGWVWKARDLNMSGHRGSLWTVPCEDMEKVFDPDTGTMVVPAPYMMSPDEFARFRTQHWGSDKAAEDEFMRHNVASSEEHRRNKDLKVD